MGSIITKLICNPCNKGTNIKEKLYMKDEETDNEDDFYKMIMETEPILENEIL